MVEWCDGTTAEIIAIGGNTLYYIDDGKDEVDWTRADTNRHHRAPTVEDVLDEMLQRFAEDGYEGDLTDFIASYATKLQLKED